MKSKEFKRRFMLSYIMRKAWKIFWSHSCNLRFGTCLRISWRLIKGILFPRYSKVKGVTFNNRQLQLQKLQNISFEKIHLSLHPEPTNKFDSNALSIVATVAATAPETIVTPGTTITLGYVSRDLSYYFNEQLKQGKQIILFLENITGKLNTFLGVNYSYLII